MPSGVVKEFFADRGYGYITPDDGGDDVLVDRKVVGAGHGAYLEQGQHVQFEIQWDEWHCSSCTGFKARDTGTEVEVKRRKKEDGKWAQSSIGSFIVCSIY